MKTQKITFGLVTIIMAGSIMFTSCKKPKRETDTDTGSAADHSYAENAANDMVSMGDQAAVGGTLSTYKLAEGSPSNTYFTACATISLYNADSLNADTVMVDFGTGCLGSDGRTRVGKIQYVYTGGRFYRDSGIVITVSPIGYSVEGNGITGTKTIKNKGRINGNMTWDITANLVINKSDGTTVTWNCNRTKTLLNTSTTYNGPSVPITWTQARVGIVGSAWGVSSSGDAYNANVTSQLIRDFSCTPDATRPHRHPFIQGSVDFTPGSKPTRHLDFGPGSCDFNATVTINGNVHNITLR